MRIRVKYRDIEIEVSEEGAINQYSQTAMRQEKTTVKEVIEHMTDQVIKLKEESEKENK